MQLELWNASIQTAMPAHKHQRGARVLPATTAAEAARAVCIDPDLVPEPTCDPELAFLQACVIEFVRRARGSATRKAYSSDWKLFERWCGAHGQVALPTTPATLALYLTHLAEVGRKYSTIRRARTAIGQVHCAANMSRPDHDLGIRALERGIARTIGTRQRGAPPLCLGELERVVVALEADSIRNVRDRALLLLGGHVAPVLAISSRSMSNTSASPPC